MCHGGTLLHKVRGVKAIQISLLLDIFLAEWTLLICHIRFGWDELEFIQS